ncbi:hypothetical protein UCRPC4_g01881 [Phaeomoniella chlamydospora]|uniref:Uncharacterized protein n=1 Tax=Phaeomoniella chlamydospora TaxID=158046 RepID=A0A0G2ET24_PHACM|nr:hypothetical protein UCRPC4_g01881 [Phaeomoniella chlamydospora]
MSRPKAFLKAEKARKKQARTNPALLDADDILAEGVEFEEAGEKWRAGDAAKSMRFFTRALDMYTQGLQRFPQNLDLAYNKARIQLEMATHPVLVHQLQVPLLAALNETLGSHQYALQLDQENPDTLFNTAQVMTTMAEEIAKDDQRPDSDAIQLLEQALNLFQRCLAIQEQRFTEFQNQSQNTLHPGNTDPEPPAPELLTGPQGSSPTANEQQEQWASIIEPITMTTLLDTLLAQISALTTLTNLIPPHDTTLLPSIEKSSSILLNEKIPLHLSFTSTDSTIHPSISLAKTNLLSSLLDHNFRSSKITLETYRTELLALFTTYPPSTPESHLSQAQSLLSFNSSLTDHIPPGSPSYPPSLLHRWQSLTRALETLTLASKHPETSPDEMIQTHSLRGDVSLLQFRLSEKPAEFPTAVNHAETLLRNARTFYTNVGKLERDGKKGNAEVKVKSLVVEALVLNGLDDKARGGDGLQGWRDVITILGKERIAGFLEDMLDEGLVRKEVVEGIWIGLQ